MIIPSTGHSTPANPYIGMSVGVNWESLYPILRKVSWSKISTEAPLSTRTLLTGLFPIIGVMTSGSSWGNFTPSRSESSKANVTSVLALFGASPTICITSLVYAFLEFLDNPAAVGPPKIVFITGPRGRRGPPKIAFITGPLGWGFRP